MKFPRLKGSFEAQLPGETNRAEHYLWIIWFVFSSSSQQRLS